jgi:hypothetical protein
MTSPKESEKHLEWRRKIEQFVDIDSKQPRGHENKSQVYIDMRDTVYSHTDGCAACGDFELHLRCKNEGIAVGAFPCVHIAYYSSALCEAHDSGWDCTDVSIVKDENGEWGLPIRDQEDGSAETMLRIRHCPWCGTPLVPGNPEKT